MHATDPPGGKHTNTRPMGHNHRARYRSGAIFFAGMLVTVAGVCGVVLSRSLHARANADAAEWLSALTLATGLSISLGGLGVFLYGMRVMSGGLQKVAGDRLRAILSATKVAERELLCEP